MELITLNKCLSGLDTIIYHDYDNENNNIRSILNNTRQYMITLIERRDKRSFMVILQFINYLIQESFTPITIHYINLVVGLRYLIIKFEENNLEISDDYIDFDEAVNSFLSKYLELK